MPHVNSQEGRATIRLAEAPINLAISFSDTLLTLVLKSVRVANSTSRA